MSNSLDEQIRKQAGMLDNALPPMGHFERFEQRLERHEKKKHTHWRRWIITTSAAAAIALILTFQYSRPRQAMSYPESIQEVTAYYNRQLQDEIGKVREETDYITDLQSQREVRDNIEDMQIKFQKWGASLPRMSEEDHIALIVLRYNAEMESLQRIRAILEDIPNNQQHKL